MNSALRLALLLISSAAILFAQNSITHLSAQAPPASEQHLLGKIQRQALKLGVFAEWFDKGYRDYTPNNDVIKKFSESLTKQQISQVRFKIFFGTWCGDSKRELPRFLKLLDMLGISEDRVDLIGLDRSDTAYKRSPTNEERNYDIFRVPTFILERQNKEIERITEYPVESLERDVFTIIAGKPYISNYFSYKLIQEWLKAGTLADSNVSIVGLSGQIRRTTPLASESELNGCGYVLMGRGQLREALTVFRINAFLFPQSSNCLESLSECYEKNGLSERAIITCERALEIDPKNAPALKRLIKLKTTAGHTYK